MQILKLTDCYKNVKNVYISLFILLVQKKVSVIFFSLPLFCLCKTNVTKTKTATTLTINLLNTENYKF